MAMIDWLECIVEEVAAPIRNALVGGPFGSNLVSDDYVPYGVPVIRGQNMGHGRWVEGEFAFVSENKAHELVANTARPGDLIFTQRGTLGQIAIVPDGAYDRYVVSQSQMKLTVDPEKADVFFLYYFFSAQEQVNYFRQNAIQTGVPHTNLAILRNTPLYLPPLDKQREIAKILSSFDDKIELNRRMNNALELACRALFRSWFVDFDPVFAKVENRQPEYLDTAIIEHFPEDFEQSEFGDIPTGWKVAPIGDIVSVVGGSTPSTKEQAYWDNGEISWATPKDLSSLSSPVLLGTDRQITNLGLQQISSGLLPAGTVLLSSRAPIGYLVISEIPIAINQGFIAMICDGPISNLYTLFWTQANMDEIKARAGGTTFQEISKTNFRPISVIVPPSDILKAFDDIVMPLYRRIVSNLREIDTLSVIRDTLLTKLISGEVSL